MSLFDQTISLYRATIGQDASGGATTTYPNQPTLSGIVASIQPASARDMDVWQRRNIVFDYWIYSQLDFDVAISGGLKLKDKFVDGSGRQFVVQGFLDHRNAGTSIGILYKIPCHRVVS